MNPLHRRDPAKGARLKKIIFALCTAGLILLLALVNFLVPLQTLLPPYKLPAREAGEMRLHFMDVGQGDCTVVEFPEGDIMIVDSGDGAFQSENKLVRYIKGLNPTGVTLVATHADIDHYGGFAELIECFGAQTVYTPLLDTQTGSYQRFAAAVKKSGAEVKTLTRYSVISRPSGAYAVCISPCTTDETDENDTSAVLYLDYGGVGIVLGGDITARWEEKLLSDYAFLDGIFDSGEYSVRLEDTDILKVSHHGSASSSSEEWLSLLSPRVAVLSCGRGNPYSHPAAESVTRLAAVGAEIYRTDELGNIAVSIKDGNYTILE